MAEQYWLGGFFIDLSRNQITHNNETLTLPPKVLAVLTYLAEHQGRVVSQDDLLDNIWKETVVSPNTLQRCIAQLRKALGDDSRQQQIIKTHAKKGYSLECSVSWQNGITPQTNNEQDKGTVAETITAGSTESVESSGAVHKDLNSDYRKANKSFNRSNIVVLAVLLLAAGGVMLNSFLTKPEHHFVIDNIRPLTSTDNRELASVYSPDGQYIVFKRFPEVLCVNNLWAKNIATQEEFQLTQDIGAYGNPAFSADGKTLAFVKEVDCRAPITQNSCYKLQSLDFEQALRAPQSPETLMECKNTEIRTASWLNQDEIALMQQQEDRWQLISYSIQDNKSTTLFSPDEGNLTYYDYSPELQLLALSRINSKGKAYIEMRKPDGELVSSREIRFPDNIAKYRPIYPRFSARDGVLLFSTGRQIFSLSDEGQVARVSVPLDEAMGTPVFHPDGKHMLAIKGHYDSDIVLLPRPESDDAPGEITRQQMLDSALVRSTLGEDHAAFQPGGDWIAYSSGRSGTDQIWLTDGARTKQLSQFPLDTFIRSFAWATDGQGLLVSASHELRRIELDGGETEVQIPYPVTDLFHWDRGEQTALAMAQIQGFRRLVEIDLEKRSVRIVNNKKVLWAQKTEDGRVIYMDNMDRFWQPGPAEEQLLPIEYGAGSHKHFVVRDQQIYGINSDYQLWYYNLEDNTSGIIAQLPDTVDYITDINEQQMLLTLRVAASKEVVELTLQ